MNLGIIYAATGKKYISECLRSLESLMRNIHGIPITIFTNDKSVFSEIDNRCVNVVELTEPKCGFQDKITALTKSPFEKTLFLDTDTVILKNPSSLLSLLDRFDMAACAETYTPHPTENIPESFPEFNTGVLALKTGSPEVKKFLAKWTEVYSQAIHFSNAPKHDQPSFREVLYKSSLNFCTLSSDWNFFLSHPALLNAGSDIKILHSRLDKRLFSSQIYISTRHSRVFLSNSRCLHHERLGSADWRLDTLLRFVALPFRFYNLFKYRNKKYNMLK